MVGVRSSVPSGAAAVLLGTYGQAHGLEIETLETHRF
jgi:hypothetical protein